MKNPFVYGEEVVGKNFIDREKEIKELVRDLESNERIFLISPRRYGKTSMIVKIFELLEKKKWLTARIDLYKATSLQSYANLYTVSVISKIESKPEKLLRLIKEYIPSLRPTISFNQSGEAELSLNINPQQDNIEILLDKLYDIPEKIAIKHKKRIVIAFDEFQELRTLNGHKLEKALRSSIQKHHNVSYIFSGSKRSVIYDMVTKPANAFYKMGKIFNLGKINEPIFKKFIISKFSSGKMSITEDGFKNIFIITENIPYNVQYLCHQLWDKCYGKKNITIRDLEDTISEITANQSPIYIRIWDNLTLHQRRLLKSIAISGGKRIFAQNHIQQYNLNSPASAQTSVKLLMSNGILDRENDTYIFLDVFFKEWIKRKIK